MHHRIEIVSQVLDTRAPSRKKKLHSLGLAATLSNLEVVDVYTIVGKFTAQQMKRITQALVNPLIQVSFIDTPYEPADFSYAIEVGFLPGVTDNVANTTCQLIADILKKQTTEPYAVYTSQETLVWGELTLEQVKLMSESLYNPLIQRAQVKSRQQFHHDHGMTVVIPETHLHEATTSGVVNLEVSDTELEQLGTLGVQNADGTRRGPLALSLDYMKTIQAYFRTLGRLPTDIELESLAQTWSEHCKHTIFADPIDELKDGLYRSYIKAATQVIRKRKGKHDFCVSVFSDNSGAIAFDDQYYLTHKVETHNSPSALDPFGGAVTGIVGVNRDAIGFGLGAKPVINTYGFCVADPADTQPLYKDKNQQLKMLSPRRILDGVVAGVNTGGNCSGIPSPQGFLYFDPRYKGKPLVFAGTVGLIPHTVKGKSSAEKQAQPGDYIVMVGGRVGKDGIHGATFSSVALDAGSPATAVQIGDPITQKKLSDALVKEARDLGLYHSITDNGAGGLSCSVAEMAKECGGCRVQLETVPLKYPGLAPWEIWISESQERMTLAVPPSQWKAFQAVMAKHDVEATHIGEFTDSGRCVVEYAGSVILDLEMAFLHDGLPQRHLKTHQPKVTPQPKPLLKTTPLKTTPSTLSKTLIEMVGRLNMASYECVSQQYDHSVQASAVLGPLQGRGRVNADATVTRPVLSSHKGVALSQSLYPRYSDLDTYAMAAAAIDTAIRNLVCVGANPDQIALLDNFCWCSSNEPERLWQLKQAAQACYDLATAFGAPFISGKDSMFNDFKGFDEQGKSVKISIPPTLLISSVSVIDDVQNTISLDTKQVDDVVYLVGETAAELGGSEYCSYLGDQHGQPLYTGTQVPRVNAQYNRALYTSFFTAAQKGIVTAAVSIGRGGLGYAAARMAMAGQLGIQLDLTKVPVTKQAHNVLSDISAVDQLLFSESQGRVLCTVPKDQTQAWEKIMAGTAFAQLGRVTNDQQIVMTSTGGKEVVRVTLAAAVTAYRQTFQDF